MMKNLTLIIIVDRFNQCVCGGWVSVALRGKDLLYSLMCATACLRKKPSYPGSNKGI